MATVLFVCKANRGRSVMSEALFERAAAGRHRAISAGSEAVAGGGPHPEVVEAMRELGIDLAGRSPRPLEPGDAEWADVGVTMGCGDAYPYLPGKRYVDWKLEDRAGRTGTEVRRIRAEIEARVRSLLDQLDAASPHVSRAQL